MAALVFNHCCGCIELKTGCFILGYFNLVGVILLLAVSAFTLVAGTILSLIHESALILLIITILLFIIVVLALVFAIVLLVGLHQNKPGHLKAYLIYSGIFLFLYVIQFCMRFAAVGPVPVVFIIQGVLVMLLQVYFLLVIRSMYYHMMNSEQGKFKPAAQTRFS